MAEAQETADKIDETKEEPQKVSAGAKVGMTGKQAPREFRVMIGRKLGMTQIFDSDGNLHSVSVIEAGPCSVVNIRTVAKDGYGAVCLGFGEISEKKLIKPKLGYFKKNGIAPLKYLKEYRVSKTDGFEIGQLVTLSGRFAEGDYIDIRGITKGKGFAGVMKRHGFRGLPASHGASDKERSPGSISSQRSLGRVIPGQKMPGRMGHRQITVCKVMVSNIDEMKNLIYVNGCVPGPRGSIVSILETSKPKKKKEIKKAETKKSKKAKKGKK